jgi:spore coat polysaccharide biosynthesis protein SpsF (cytidylyltransferase family)
LPGKIFEKIYGKTILEHCLSNCVESMVHTWALAVPHKDPRISDMRGIAEEYSVCVHNPNRKENDVLGRFADIATGFNVEWIVRVTSDCPFVKPDIINQALMYAMFTGRFITDQYNEGSTVQVFTKEDLMRADRQLKGRIREHVCEGFRKGWVKGSIDTREELLNARKNYKK